MNFILIFSLFLFSHSNVMYWTEQHNIILCREVVFENPYLYKKGSPQRSETWKKIVDVLNKCASPQFNVDHRAIRDHINVLVNKYKKKIRAEERASGISPDEPSELDELIQQIIALEESAPTDTCSKDKADKAKAEDVRMKAMERLSQTNTSTSNNCKINSNSSSFSNNSNSSSSNKCS